MPPSSGLVGSYLLESDNEEGDGELFLTRGPCRSCRYFSGRGKAEFGVSTQVSRINLLGCLVALRATYPALGLKGPLGSGMISKECLFAE